MSEAHSSELSMGQWPSSSVGIVVIGRNEGDRLVRCLESVRRQSRIVYVDSGSTDKSVERASALGAEVVELDMTKPFTAARARNAGFARLREIAPDMKFVQFVDGDSEVASGWLGIAAQALESQDRIAIVCGRLRERFPEHSLFNRLADFEWDAPIGDVQSCGGILMVRADEFERVKGFHEDVIAGEEPELCSRLVQDGWRVHRLSQPMAFHDIAMTRFSQWWWRQVRAGYGGLYTFERCAGQTFRPFGEQIRSARTWVVGWPVAVALGSMGGAAMGGVRGALFGAMLAGATLPLQILRIAARQRGRSKSIADAVLYATFLMIAKVPQFIGQVRRMREKRAGIAATIIEHK